MVASEDLNPDRSLDGIETDEAAFALLPPNPLARPTYTRHRSLGHSPREALQYTLDLWRELQEAARPSWYGKIDRHTD